RRIFRRIELAIGLVVHELAVARDRDHGARHPLRRDLAREEIVHPRQSLLREADLLRPRLGQRCGNGGIESDGGKRRCGRAELLHWPLRELRILVAYAAIECPPVRMNRSRKEERQVSEPNGILHGCPAAGSRVSAVTTSAGAETCSPHSDETVCRYCDQIRAA